MSLSRRSFLQSTVAAAGLAIGGGAKAAPSEIRLDFATYNPLSLVLREKGLVEKALAADGVGVRWVQTLGSSMPARSISAQPPAPRR
jgi:sulfonate transport system substrate-binding protein